MHCIDMEIAIVIAAYNEGKNIVEVIKQLRKYKYDNIIVVDDGSKDNTYTIAKKSGVTALRHIINRGQGAALRTGTNYAIEHGADIVVHFDADGQHKADEIKQMIEPLKKGVVDITLGSRFLGKAENITTGKKVVLKLGAIVQWVFSGILLTDSHNGFRAMNKDAASKIRITFDRMEHASEIIEEISRNQLRYQEVPVTIIYHEAGQHPLRSIKMGTKLVMKKVLGW